MNIFILYFFIIFFQLEEYLVSLIKKIFYYAVDENTLNVIKFHFFF